MILTLCQSFAVINKGVFDIRVICPFLKQNQTKPAVLIMFWAPKSKNQWGRSIQPLWFFMTWPTEAPCNTVLFSLHYQKRNVSAKPRPPSESPILGHSFGLKFKIFQLALFEKTRIEVYVVNLLHRNLRFSIFGHNPIFRVSGMVSEQGALKKNCYPWCQLSFDTNFLVFG